MGPVERLAWLPPKPSCFASRRAGGDRGRHPTVVGGVGAAGTVMAVFFAAVSVNR
jgi:hypothetical protein